jgi:hypothetical protein
VVELSEGDDLIAHNHWDVNDEIVNETTLLRMTQLAL